MTHEQLKITEPSADEINVGYYGNQWIEFMERCHPKIYKRLEKNNTLYAVAKSVNEDARNYKLLLDRQYEQLHPRPCDDENDADFRSWRFTRNFYTDGTVMRERVLIPYSKP
jgi:hypothetical protein